MKKSLLVTVYFCVLSGFSNLGMALGWELSEKVDKMSLEKIIGVKKRFLDTEVPGVIVDFSINCVNNESFFAEATTFSSTPEGELLPGVAIRGIEHNSRFTLLETRIDTSKVIFPAAFKDFSNSIQFELKLIIKEEIFENPIITAMGLDASILYAFNNEEFLTETSSMFDASEWVIRIPTIQGNPIIEVNLKDSKVKAVFKACNWGSGQASVSNKPTQTSPQISSPTPPAESPTTTTLQEATPVQTPSDNISFAPSFDCLKANNGAERLICSDRDLSKLDVALNQEYIKSRDASSNKLKLRAEQLEWIKTKRNSCSDKACMVETYRERISQLSEISTN